VHRLVKIEAAKRNMTIRDFVEGSLAEELSIEKVNYASLRE